MTGMRMDNGVSWMGVAELVGVTDCWRLWMTCEMAKDSPTTISRPTTASMAILVGFDFWMIACGAMASIGKGALASWVNTWQSVWVRLRQKFC